MLNIQLSEVKTTVPVIKYLHYRDIDKALKGKTFSFTENLDILKNALKLYGGDANNTTMLDLATTSFDNQLSANWRQQSKLFLYKLLSIIKTIHTENMYQREQLIKYMEILIPYKSSVGGLTLAPSDDESDFQYYEDAVTSATIKTDLEGISDLTIFDAVISINTHLGVYYAVIALVLFEDILED